MTKKDSDRRRESRRNYAGHIFFASDQKVCEGELKNFSRSGLFISSDMTVKVGEEITIALPYLDDKRNGLIVWCNNDGFGVKLAQPHEETVSPARLYRRISSRVIGLFR